MTLQHHSLVVTHWVYALIKGTVGLLLTNLPYLLLVLNFYTAKNANERWTLLVTGVVLIPFVFAPGALATFNWVRHFFEGDANYPYWQTLIRAYRQNYQLAMKLGGIFAAGLVICYASYLFYGQWGIVGRLVPLVAALILLIVFVFVLIYASDRVATVRTYWRNGSLLLLTHPVLAFFMIAESGLLLYFCHFQGALLTFVAPGGVALICVYFYLQCVAAETKKRQQQTGSAQ